MPTGTTPTALSTILNMTLADNGEPTDTHNLVPGSPAINASPHAADCQPTDQRGVPRPYDTGGKNLLKGQDGNDVILTLGTKGTIDGGSRTDMCSGDSSQVNCP